ncbi:alpha/beta fold hydrolase [Nesterenkonia haasae]|uniref:alpha/beta fold hydrolase n=1 Tax=Nesterenkonia haasae TaxID=2587813 RepID=UPI0013916B97|nr:alpha/beta hydrolase [Nesterenkonia haasae]NDK31779.1 alpha/beta hydrolase [Nesterenkonia haasae]
MNPDPLSTPEIIHSLQRLTTPDAIDLTTIVPLGGVPQVVSVRGRNRVNPVLLFLHGGPGTPLAPTGWMWQRPIEEFFTVVHYDQRGAGRSYRIAEPDVVRPAMTINQYVQDAAELVEWLKVEFSIDRVILVGHSWGTVIATTLAHQRPNLVEAYLGIGQVIDFRAGETSSYSWLCNQAASRDDDQAIRELDALAPYPGEQPLNWDKMSIHRKWVERYGGFAAGRSDCDYYTQGEVTSLDYQGENRRSTTEGNQLSLEVILPQLFNADLTNLTSFDVPIIQFLGRHDQLTPTEPVTRWMAGVNAPRTEIEWFEDSAHMLMNEEPGHFLTALVHQFK